MKRLLAALVSSASLLAIAQPAFAILPPSNFECNDDTETGKARCERTQNASTMSRRTTRTGQNANPELKTIMERRLLRRADTGDSKTYRKPTTEEGVAKLKARRLDAREDLKMRRELYKVRLGEIRKKQSEELKMHIETVKTRGTMTRKSVREISKEMDKENQRRREADRILRDKCLKLGIEERQQCLNEGRKS